MRDPPLLCISWKGLKWCCQYVVWVTLSRKETYTDISPLCQPDTLLRLQSNNVNLCFGDWGCIMLIYGMDSRFSDPASVCVRMVYLYIQCDWGVVKASTGNSIMLFMAHMSGALLLCSFTPRHGWGDHISMCGCSVIHWCSVCSFQDTFLGLPVTLLEFMGEW